MKRVDITGQRFGKLTVLCNIAKSDLEHRPGWDRLATARSHVFRREHRREL